MAEKVQPGGDMPYGQINPMTDAERILGQEARGEIDTSVEAVRQLAAEMDATGGTGVLGKGETE
jgi:hypothetical protein